MRKGPGGPGEAEQTAKTTHRQHDYDGLVAISQRKQKRRQQQQCRSGQFTANLSGRRACQVRPGGADAGRGAGAAAGAGGLLGVERGEDVCRHADAAALLLLEPRADPVLPRSRALWVLVFLCVLVGAVRVPPVVADCGELGVRGLAAWKHLRVGALQQHAEKLADGGPAGAGEARAEAQRGRARAPDRVPDMSMTTTHGVSSCIYRDIDVSEYRLCVPPAVTG